MQTKKIVGISLLLLAVSASVGVGVYYSYYAGVSAGEASSEAACALDTTQCEALSRAKLLHESPLWHCVHAVSSGGEEAMFCSTSRESVEAVCDTTASAADANPDLTYKGCLYGAFVKL